MMRVLLVAAMVTAMAGCSTATAPPPPPAVTTIPTTQWSIPLPPGPKEAFGDGRYEVGVDIKPGKYKTTGGTGPDKCYWARLKDLNGLVSSAIATGYDETGPDIVTIDPKDKGFETHACGVWRLVQ